MLAAIFLRPELYVDPVLEVGRMLWSLTLFTYAWLAWTYADGNRKTSVIANVTILMMDEIPLWKFGTFIVLSCAQSLPKPFSTYFYGTLIIHGLVGFWIAAKRGRIIAWPVTFWFGIGHQLAYDSIKWRDPAYWFEHVYCQGECVLKAVSYPFKYSFTYLK